MPGTRFRYLGLAKNNPDADALIGNPTSPPKGFRRFVTAALPLLPILALTALLLGLSLAGTKFSNTTKNWGCDPNGNVWVTHNDRPDVWAKNYGLAITLGMGELSFSSAKAIDVLWDLVVGRGAQVLSAVLIYHVFRGPVAASMRHYPVPYQKVLKLQYNTTSVSSFFAYCSDVRRSKRSAKQYFAALTLAICTLYVLILPTWISAMTGYQAINMPLFETKSGAYVPFDGNLVVCSYIVEDGTRIGLADNTCAVWGSNLAHALTSYLSTYVDYNYTNSWTGNANPRSGANISSSFTNPNTTKVYNLHPPLLNISTSHTFTYQGQNMNITYLAEHGTCAPQKTYQWGFSLILLFMFLSVTWLFGWVVYGIWLRQFWKSTAQGGDYARQDSRNVFGRLRTAVAVGESIEQELGTAQARSLSDGGLQTVLKRRGAGMRMNRKGDEMGLVGNATDPATTDPSLPKPYHSRTMSAAPLVRPSTHSRTPSGQSLV